MAAPFDPQPYAVAAWRRLRSGEAKSVGWCWFLVALVASLGANVATAGLLDLDDVPAWSRILVAGRPAVAFLGGTLLAHGAPKTSRAMADTEPSSTVTDPAPRPPATQVAPPATVAGLPSVAVGSAPPSSAPCVSPPYRPPLRCKADGRGFLGSDSAAPLLATYKSLVEGLRTAGVHRLLVVGGAGSLKTASGQDRVHTPDFPAMYKAESLAQREVLRLLRAEVGDDLDWTYVSPADEIAPGERTGTFRLGGDDLLIAEDGTSFISAEDYAVALVDEAEKSTAIRRRITVAY